MNNSKNITHTTRILYSLCFLLVIAFPAIFLHCPQAVAKDILVIQSYKVKPYNDALKGFKSSCTEKIGNVVFHEQGNNATINEAARKTHADLIVAIGMEALAKAKNIKNIPIIYMMVLHPDSILQGEKNITGVSMNISPERHLAVMHKVLPARKRIGLLYDPRKNGHYVKKAIGSAKAYGLEVNAQETYSPRDVPHLIEKMKSEVDLLWVLPDITVVTGETINSLLLFSMEEKTPLHVFSSKYLEMGALMSLEADPIDLGRQAGEMAAKILSGVNVAEIPQAEANNPVLSINTKVARKLGISIPSEILNNARLFR